MGKLAVICLCALGGPMLLLIVATVASVAVIYVASSAPEVHITTVHIPAQGPCRVTNAKLPRRRVSKFYLAPARSISGGPHERSYG